MRSKLAIVAILLGGLALQSEAMARPDADPLDTRSPASRSDLDRSQGALKLAKQTPPSPSKTLKQRELVGRALAVEFQTWARVSMSYDPDVYALYVAKFPRGLFAPLARARAMSLLERREFEETMKGMR